MSEQRERIFAEIWQRCDPNNPNFANHLDQLFEAKAEIERMRALLREWRGTGTQTLDSYRNGLCKRTNAILEGQPDTLNQRILAITNTPEWFDTPCARAIRKEITGKP